MICVFCKTDKIKDVFTTYERNIKGKKIIVQNVPAKFCEACGDYYFDSKIVDSIREKIIKVSGDIEAIEIYNFNNIY